MVQVWEVAECGHGQPALPGSLCLTGKTERVVDGPLRDLGEAARGQHRVRREVCGQGRGEQLALAREDTMEWAVHRSVWEAWCWTCVTHGQ